MLRGKMETEGTSICWRLLKDQTQYSCSTHVILFNPCHDESVTIPILKPRLKEVKQLTPDAAADLQTARVSQTPSRFLGVWFHRSLSCPT